MTRSLRTIRTALLTRRARNRFIESQLALFDPRSRLDLLDAGVA